MEEGKLPDPHPWKVKGKGEPMKMEEIDRRREVLEKARDERKNWEAAVRENGRSWRDADSLSFAEACEIVAETNVLGALREWWTEEPIREFAKLAEGDGKCDCNRAPCPHDAAGTLVETLLSWR